MREWQELVIRHLAVSDWTRLVSDDELDIVGPYVCRVLAQHGLLWRRTRMPTFRSPPTARPCWKIEFQC